MTEPEQRASATVSAVEEVLELLSPVIQAAESLYAQLGGLEPESVRKRLYWAAVQLRDVREDFEWLKAVCRS